MTGSASEKSMDKWDRVITAKPPLFRLGLSEIWSYRYLIAMFVRRDFVAAYKQTILGPLWFVIPPLLTSLTFTVIFGQIANLPTDGLPQFLFYMAGVVIWNHFNTTVTGNAAIFSSQSGLFSKVYFPRLIVPFASFLSGLLHLAVQLGLLALFVAYYLVAGSAAQPQWTLALLPVLILVSGMIGLSTGIVASALTTRYKDLSFLISYGMSLWMYVTPVIYPISVVPEAYRWLILLNPMSAVVATFRHAVLGAGEAPLGWLLYSFVFGAVAFYLSIVVFHRIERIAMDTV
jgi:lipopolysaccharide transport system permease protein